MFHFSVGDAKFEVFEGEAGVGARAAVAGLAGGGDSQGEEGEEEPEDWDEDEGMAFIIFHQIKVKVVGNPRITEELVPPSNVSHA